MKILNIFKRESSRTSDSKNVSASITTKLDKTQLKKVIGGNGGLTLDESASRFKKQIETTDNES